MRFQADPRPPRDSTVLLFLFALLLFLSPLTWWWASDRSPWFLPYVLWLALIGLLAWNQWRRGHHDL
jgi:hypothetical protein